MPSGIIRTHEDFINDMKVKHPTFTILGHYERADILIAVKCNKCGHEWKTRPNSLYRNGKCPKCEASNRKPSQQKAHDKLKREYAEKHNIKLLEIWYKDYKRVDEILAQNLVS